MMPPDRTLPPSDTTMLRRAERGGLGPLVWIAVCASVTLAACSSAPRSGGGGGKGGGGYYQDDGPPSNPPANLDQVPEPLPAVEPLASGANKPYVVFGKRYVPFTSLTQPYRVTGTASWYGRKFNGARTSNGEIYDMYGMTAAHATLPIPSYARVTRTATGKSVIVRVNDRGPFHEDRVIDLSYTAAYKLGLLAQGSGEVTVELLGPEEIARIRTERGNPTMLAGAGGASATAVADASPVAETAPVALDGNAQDTQMRELPPVAQATTASAYGGNGGLVMSPPRVAGAANPASPGATVAVPAGATAPVAVRGQQGIFLQLGAFSGERNAEDLATRVKTQAPAVGDLVRVIDADNLHKVHVGPYPSRESALAAAQQLQAQANVTAVIVVR